MNPIFTLEHIGLAARDPEALKNWYVSVLGAAEVFRMPQTPPAFLLGFGPLMLEIYPAHAGSAETANNRHAGWRHIALKVASLEAARAHLEERGVQFTESVKPAGGGGRVLFFQDPEGNLLHLTERLPAGFA